jgi:cytochrome P450
MRFAPERWLESHRDKFPIHTKEASQPFMTGPRGCIGKNLSYIEQRLIICHLLWHFDVELASDFDELNKLWILENDMKHMVSYLIWVKPALWVNLKRVIT